MRAHRVEMEKDIAKDKRRARPIRSRLPRSEHGFIQTARYRSQVFHEALDRRSVSRVRFWRDLIHTVTVVPVGTFFPSSTIKLSPPKCFTSSQGKAFGAGPLITDPSLANLEP